MTHSNIISLRDCEQVVRDHFKSNDIELERYLLQPYSNNVDGSMGDYYSLIVFVKDNHETLKFFLKRFPLQHEYALSIGAFANEIATYEIIFEKFKRIPGFDGSFAPRFYFGKVNDILVFEDLATKGFTLTTQPHINSLNHDHVKLPLRYLARYHSGSIAYEEFQTNKLGRRYKLPEEYGKYMQEPLFRKDENFLGYQWFRAGLKGLLSLIDVLQQDCLSQHTFKEGLLKLADEALEIMLPNDRFRNVLSHGDMWTKNIMYRYENGAPVECKLIDFQLQRYMPPSHDVLQWIYLTTSSKDRQIHLQELLLYYYDCLRRELENMRLNIKTLLPYEDFGRSIDYILPQIKLQTALYYSFQGANAEFLRNVNFKQFFYVDRSPFALELFATDYHYKYLMSMALNELADLIKSKYIS